MTINYKPNERDRMESNPEMHPRRVSEFTKVVGGICVPNTKSTSSNWLSA